MLREIACVRRSNGDPSLFRLTFGLILAIGVISLPAALTAANVPAPLPDLSTFPNSLGVNIHFTDPKPAELDQIYAAGFRWVRMDFQWEAIEHTKGNYDFSAYDRLITALDQHHIKALFILDYGNRFYDNGQSPNSDEGRAAFAKWAAASVHHFKGRGIIWEMWNEPNGGFWKPKANVDDYAKLALATGKALREAEPGEIYIGPATSTIDMTFLEACFKAGCLEYWSAVSVHPYRQKDPETAADEYRALRRLIAKYAPKDRQIPIISGEWGYSSVWQNFDEDRQAKYLPREMLTNLANDVPLSIWYDWHEDGKDPKEPEHHFGIVRADAVNKDGMLYEPKKAYMAASEMSRTLNGFRFNKRLAIGGDDSHVLLFDNGADKIILVPWATSDAHLELPIPITGDATVRTSSGLDIAAHAGAVRYKPDDALAYIIPIGREDLLRIAAAWSRAPGELSVNGPALAKIETTVRNPLDHPITVRVGEQHAVVKPGENYSLISEVRVTRSAVETTLLSSLDVEGLGRVAQRTRILVANPLTAFSFPPVGNRQQVRIEIPDGHAIHARAKLTGADEVTVETHDGETEKTITFTFDRKNAENPGKPFTLIDETGQLLLEQDHADAFVSLNLKSIQKEGVACYLWQLLPDGDPKVASTQALTEGSPPDGPPAPGAECVKIDYRFEKGWKFLRLAPTDARKYSDATKLGLWVHGDASANVARMRFTDSTGQTFQPDGGRITWTGWRYIEFPITGHDLAHWGGANDGAIHFPIHIDTLFLLDSSDRHASQGQIYLSTPTLIYAK